MAVNSLEQITFPWHVTSFIEPRGQTPDILCRGYTPKVHLVYIVCVLVYIQVRCMLINLYGSKFLRANNISLTCHWSFIEPRGPDTWHIMQRLHSQQYSNIAYFFTNVCNKMCSIEAAQLEKWSQRRVFCQGNSSKRGRVLLNCLVNLSNPRSHCFLFCLLRH